MSYKNCICLNCSGVMAIASDSISEIENVTCPNCGSKSMVMVQAEGVLSGGG
jgi:DNA-directed RNA polymerase subunit RPC12/RpoP